MDDMTVNEASVKYIRDNFAEVIDDIVENKKPYVITRYGRTKAYLVSKSEYDKFLKFRGNNEIKVSGSEDKKLKALKSLNGLWKYRNIKDSVEYAKRLRKIAEKRGPIKIKWQDI
jgi:prevent-host-death family protein